MDKPPAPANVARQPGEAALAPRAQTEFAQDGVRHAAPGFHRDDLRAGDRIDGPARLIEPTGTGIVEPDWRAELDAKGALGLRPTRAAQRSHSRGPQVDPGMLEKCNDRSVSIAEHTG